ncbi:hypothetical protein BDW71DRAFT_33489 [Aspergillus fruticulosus]
MPRFQVLPVADIDFPSLTASLWESFETPPQGLLRLFMPILNNDRERSLKTCLDAQLAEYHQQQPQCTWIKVVDTDDNDRIAAAAKWYFYDKSPYDKDGEELGLVADWYPEGIPREFATLAVRLFERPREETARRAHAFLHIAFTLPSYRGQGLGRMFMEWGVRMADERGLEAWLDASDMGAPLYEKFGFRRVLANKVRPVPGRELSGEEKREWAECERIMLPIEYTVMWRLVGGRYAEGETLPFEVREEK